MTLHLPEIVGPLWGVSELYLTLARRSRSGAISKDRHSLPIIWLLTVLGFASTFANWASLLLVFVPICAVVRWRIQVEEQALLEGLGEPYRAYRQRTRPLIPWVY